MKPCQICRGAGHLGKCRVICSVCEGTGEVPAFYPEALSKSIHDVVNRNPAPRSVWTNIVRSGEWAPTETR